MSRSLLSLGAILIAGCGTDVAGPSASMLACVFGEPQALQVGEVVGFAGTGNRSICLTTRDSAAVFAYIPFFAASPPRNGESDPRLAVEVLAGGIQGPGAWSGSMGALPATGPGVSLLDPAESLGERIRLGHGLHHRLREREATELEPLIRPVHTPAGARGRTRPAVDRPALPGLAGGVAASVPGSGDLLEINVSLRCTSEDIRTGRVMEVTERAIVVADVQNPTGFTDDDYAAFALAFDTLVYPVATRHFGEPSDIDGNGRTIIFFTRAVNQLNPAGSGSFTGAVFWAGDLFPPSATPRLDACPATNHAEMFYMAVPDPTGSVGPSVEAAWLRERAVHVMAHEYQHLLNAARRLYVNHAPTFERVWLNEGLSHIAEELVFYEASGLPRRANITVALLQSTPGAVAAYNRYMASNHHNLARYLERPDTASLMGADRFPTRGAAWSFLRYAADRTGAGDEAVFFGLLNSTTAGIENLDQVVRAPALAWMHDWTVALFADGQVQGIDPIYTQPSWDLRDIHGIPATHYLAPIPLTAGTGRDVRLQPGGSAYLLFGLNRDGLAGVHVDAGGSSPPRSLNGAFLRVR